MSTLPSFLQQTGPHAFTLTFSSSGADMFGLCGMKFSWAYLTRIEAATPRAGQNYGTGIHIPMAHRYRHMERSLAQVEEEGIALIQAHFAAHPQPEIGRKGRPEFRTATRAIQAFRAYNERYPAEDFEVLGVEEPFEVALGEFKVEGQSVADGMGWPSHVGREITVTVRFRGIRDLRVKWHDSIWVLDHKTSGEWSDLTVDEGKASFQFQGYGWVERLLAQQATEEGATVCHIPVGGVIGNYIISRENYASESRKPTPRDLPRDQFERVPYPYSDAELDEWHADAMGIAKEIWQRWREEEWPRRRTACAHWGRCEYYRLCWETDPDYRMSAAQGADYRERTPSPFEDIENGKERS